MRLTIRFEPRDMWLGVFADTKRQRLYLCLLPCLPMIISWVRRE